MGGSPKVPQISAFQSYVTLTMCFRAIYRSCACVPVPCPFELVASRRVRSGTGGADAGCLHPPQAQRYLDVKGPASPAPGGSDQGVDPVQPLPQGVGVDVEGVGGYLGGAAVFVERPRREDQLRSPPLVVAQKWPQLCSEKLPGKRAVHRSE